MQGCPRGVCWGGELGLGLQVPDFAGPNFMMRECFGLPLGWIAGLGAGTRLRASGRGAGCDFVPVIGPQV